jgi:hypothetical protein
MTGDLELIEDLTAIYGHNPDDADLWVSGLVEQHVTGSNLGATWQQIIGDFFTRSRDAGRLEQFGGLLQLGKFEGFTRRFALSEQELVREHGNYGKNHVVL